MNAAPEPSAPGASLPEPQAARRVVPIWLVIVFVGLVFWAMVYFDQRSGWANPQVYLPYHSYDELVLYQPPGAGDALARGKKNFEANCALCHNTDGTGKPNQAPPFVGSDWVLGPPNRMIRIPAYGLSGPIPINGKVWSEAPAMAAMGAALSDEDLAAVLTYVRQSWGNKASEITPQQVRAVRAEVGNRTQPWTADELQAIQ